MTIVSLASTSKWKINNFRYISEKRGKNTVRKLIRNYLMCVMKKPWNYDTVHCWREYRIVPRTVFLSKKIRTLKLTEKWQKVIEMDNVSSNKDFSLLVKNSPIICTRRKKMQFNFLANLIYIFDQNIKCSKRRITRDRVYDRKYIYACISFENRCLFKQLPPKYREKKSHCLGKICIALSGRGDFS